jgi:hypothetical protein
MEDSEYNELRTLLDLDGLVFWPNSKYWVKFSAKAVTPTDQIPHGIKYSLTLHDRNNTRIIGFDNVLSIKARKGSKFAGRIVEWDHMHKFEHVTPYEFSSAAQLLTDFWKSVDQMTGNKD